MFSGSWDTKTSFLHPLVLFRGRSESDSWTLNSQQLSHSYSHPFTLASWQAVLEMQAVPEIQVVPETQMVLDI